MKHLRKWGIPVLTGLVVLAALLLPERISDLRDRQTLGALHTVPLAEEDLTVREISLPEKLELLGRTIRYPELDVYSATQLLEQTEEHSKAQAEAAWCISRPTAVWPPVCCICGAARSTGMTIG